MGKVYTTSEDLTSIANAIRTKAKTNNSLVYPTGFVTAIGNISGDTCDGIGINPQFVTTTHDLSIKLSDTNWSSATLSTSSNTTLFTFSDDDLVTTTIDPSFAYTIYFLSYADLHYLNDATPQPRLLFTSDAQIIGKYQRLNYSLNPQEILYSTYYSTSTIDQQVCDAAINESGNFALPRMTNYHDQGIYCSGPSYALRTDEIRVRPGNIIGRITSANYFPKTTADLIDADKTTIDIKIQIYKYDRIIFNTLKLDMLKNQNEKYN